MFSVIIARVAARAVAAGLQILIMFILARDFGARSFGSFAISYAVAFVLSGILMGGAHLWVLRLGERARQPELSGVLRIACLASTGLVGVSVCGLGAPFPSAIVLAALGGAVNDQMANVVQNAFAALEKHRVASILAASARLPALGGITVALWVGESTVAPYILCTIASTVLLVMVCIPILKRKASYPSVSAWARHAGMFLASSLGQFDVLVVGFAASPTAAGYFAVGQRVAAPFSIITAALLSVFVPRLSRSETSDRLRQERRRMRVATVAYGTVVVVSAWPLAHLARVVLGEDYGRAFWFVVALVVSAAISAVSQAFIAEGVAQGKTTQVSALFTIGWVLGAGALTLGGILGEETWLPIAAVVAQILFLLLLVIFTDRRSAGAGV